MPETKVKMLGSAVASQGTSALSISFGSITNSDYTKIQLKCWAMCNDGASQTYRNLVISAGGMTTSWQGQWEFRGAQGGTGGSATGNGNTTGAINGGSMTGYSATNGKMGRMLNIDIYDPGKNNTVMGQVGMTAISFGPNAAQYSSANNSKFYFAGAFRPALNPIAAGGPTSITLTVDGSTFGAGSRVDAYGWPSGA